jgi:hypothetical protein
MMRVVQKDEGHWQTGVLCGSWGKKEFTSEGKKAAPSTSIAKAGGIGRSR